MSHTVKKKSCFKNIERLQECCDELGFAVTLAKDLAHRRRLRGPRDTLRAIIQIPGWYGGIEVHDGQLAFDGDNEAIPDRWKKLVELKKAYGRATAQFAARKLRGRLGSKQVTRNGRSGTLYTIPVRKARSGR